LDVVELCVQLLLGVLHVQRDQVSGRQEHHPKNGLGYTVTKKLLEIGGYLNKGYHVFVYNSFMSFSLIRHLYQLSTTSLYLLGGIGTFTPVV
jgi:hypothetical protein